MLKFLKQQEILCKQEMEKFENWRQDLERFRKELNQQEKRSLKITGNFLKKRMI